MEAFINFGGFQHFVDGAPLVELDPEMKINPSLDSIKSPPFPKTIHVQLSRKAGRRLKAFLKMCEARDWNAKRRCYGWTTKMMRRQRKVEGHEA